MTIIRHKDIIIKNNESFTIYDGILSNEDKLKVASLTLCLEKIYVESITEIISYIGIINKKGEVYYTSSTAALTESNWLEIPMLQFNSSDSIILQIPNCVTMVSCFISFI